VKVRFVLFADAANMSDGGRLNVLGIRQHFSFPTLPVRIPGYALVYALEGDHEDTGEAKALQIRLHDPNAVTIMEHRAQIALPGPGSGHIHIETVFDQQFAVYGTHELTVEVQGELVFSQSLFVAPQEWSQREMPPPPEE
jgi:hypothetical protein